jgi:hypothetical protein
LIDRKSRRVRKKQENKIMALEYTRRENMATGDQDGSLARSPRTPTTAKTIATGSTGEAFAGAAAVVLAIVALSGTLPTVLTAIGVIAAGAAFLFQGAAIAVRSSNASHAAGGGATGESEMAVGTSTELIGGIGCIVLGILALVGVVPVTLLAVSAIVFGGTLLFGSPAVYRVAEMGDRDDNIASQTTIGASGAQALIGMGAATLGILALLGIASMTLVQVAILCVGAGALLGGGAVTSKMVAMLSR